MEYGVLMNHLCSADMTSIKVELANAVELLRDLATYVSHEGSAQGDRDRKNLENMLTHLNKRVEYVHVRIGRENQIGFIS